MAVLTVDEFKVVLGIPAENTSQDARLGVIVAGVEAEVLAYLGIDSTDPTSYTISVDLPTDEPAPRTLWIETVPVIEVTTVTNGGTVMDAGTWRLRQSWLTLTGGRSWCRGDTDGGPSVEVVVSAGFDPGDARDVLQLSQINVAALEYAEARLIGGGGLKALAQGRVRREWFAPAEKLGAAGGPVAWPSSLTLALAPFYRAETGYMLTRR